MSDDMEKRISHAEWRLDGLEARQEKQDTKVADLGVRMDTHHREVMAAIGSLKDDNSRREGIEEARKEAEERNYKRLRNLGIVISIIGGLAALGILNWPGA